jgi:hypothetical protein
MQQVKGGCKCIMLLDFMKFGEYDTNLFFWRVTVLLLLKAST